MDKLKIAKFLLRIAKRLEAGVVKAKYRLTDETMRVEGHLLHRIQYADGKLGG